MLTGKKNSHNLLARLFLQACGILPLLTILWLGGYLLAPGPLVGGSEVAIVIPPNTFFPAIEKKLIDGGVINHDRRFRLAARLMLVSDSLKAGEYIFTEGLTPYRVLRQLYRGSMVQRAVTIPEGASLQQIAELLGRDGWVNQARFLELANSKEFINELGLDVESLEGYLFPDTYLFERGGHDAAAIIRSMAGQMRRVLAETGATSGKPEAGLNVHQLLTLASIVEKETGQALERPLIARVFLNRLRKGMKLQTDPTVIYGLKDFDGNLTRAHLREPTPYNTYVIRGLPPGPIGNPGRAAIRAVIEPAAGSYYYFVSKNNGSHYFSKSLAEHNIAVNKYQKRRRHNKKR